MPDKTIYKQGDLQIVYEYSKGQGPDFNLDLKSQRARISLGEHTVKLYPTETGEVDISRLTPSDLEVLHELDLKHLNKMASLEISAFAFIYSALIRLRNRTNTT